MLQTYLIKYVRVGVYTYPSTINTSLYSRYHQYYYRYYLLKFKKSLYSIQDFYKVIGYSWLIDSD